MPPSDSPKPRVAISLSHLMAHTHTIMAFDYGTTKTGVAVGNTLMASAEPIGLLAMHDGLPNQPALATLLRQWQPSILLVGLPLNMDGSENLLCQRAAKFASRLQAHHNLPTYLLDERLTTREARERSNHHSVDAVAAALLLEQLYSGQQGFALPK